MTNGCMMTEDLIRGHRLREAMKRRKFSKTLALATELNVSVAAISRWQNGGHVSLQSARDIAEHLDISLDWLVMGRGHLDWHRENRLTDDELELVLRYRALPDPQRSVVNQLTEQLSSIQPERNSQDRIKPR